jgi:hypothetical protein
MIASISADHDLLDEAALPDTEFQVLSELDAISAPSTRANLSTPSNSASSVNMSACARALLLDN